MNTYYSPSDLPSIGANTPGTAPTSAGYFRQGWAAGFGRYEMLRDVPKGDTRGLYLLGYFAGRDSGNVLRRIVNGKATHCPSDKAIAAAYKSDWDYHCAEQKYGPVITPRWA